MLTDDQTRRLLAEAARTITPGPEPPVALPPRRAGRPIVAAAAAILVVALVSVVLGRHSGSAPAPGAPATTGPSTAATTVPTPTPDRGDPTFHLGPNQIPPVVGYPSATARVILARHGWAVSERPEPGCAIGTANATWPAVGTPVAPGSVVVLSVSVRRQPHDAACARVAGNADPLLLWLEGLGPAPRFVSGVRYVDRGAGVDTFLLPPDAPHLDRWPHADDVARAATTPDVRQTGRGLAVVARTVATSSTCESCETRVLTVRSDGRVLMTLTYHLTSDRSIDEVTVDEHRTASPRDWPAPDVIGDSAAYATLRLRAWGYAVTRVDRPDCAPIGVVSRLALDGDTAVIGVTTRTGACDDSPLMPAG